MGEWDMLENNRSEEEFLKQYDVMVSVDLFWVILQKLMDTMESFKGEAAGDKSIGPGIVSATQGGVSPSPENISINLLRGPLWQLVAN